MRADDRDVERLHRTLPRLLPAALVAAVLGVALVFVAEATATAPHPPKPSCGWASAARVSKKFGDPVRTLAPVWREHYAPRLYCRYVERHPDDQAAGKPIVEIAFLENQRFSPRGFTPVQHLGACDGQCSVPHQPAWIRVEQDGGGGTFGAASAHTTVLELLVQDDLDAIALAVDTPDGALPVKSEQAAAESLVRSLLKRFRWLG